MIIPRTWIPKPNYQFGARLTDALQASYPVRVPNVTSLFERMRPQSRQFAGRKAAGGRMAKKFAAGLFKREDA
jgi:hypothetical protein